MFVGQFVGDMLNASLMRIGSVSDLVVALFNASLLRIDSGSSGFGCSIAADVLNTSLMRID